jgi:hypothetical protein
MLPYIKLGGTILYKYEDIARRLDEQSDRPLPWTSLNFLQGYIEKITLNKRLKPVHLSLLVALCHRWINNDFTKCYRISRSSIMKLSRIRSKATYHKTIKELQHFGHLKYTPSYHPRYASCIEMLEMGTSKCDETSFSQRAAVSEHH